MIKLDQFNFPYLGPLLSLLFILKITTSIIYLLLEYKNLTNRWISEGTLRIHRIGKLYTSMYHH